MTAEPAVRSDSKADGTGRRGSPQRRHQEIVDAAAQIFYEKGYEAASTKDIADAVGLLKGSLYYYVKSKEDFLFEIIKEVHDAVFAIKESVRAVDGDALEQLVVLIHKHVELYTSNLVKCSVFFREFRALSPERKASINAFGTTYRELVRQLLRKGQREGTFTTEIDVPIASVAVVEMLNSLSRWYHPDGRARPDRIAREFVSILLAGIASKEAIARAGGHNAFRSDPTSAG